MTTVAQILLWAMSLGLIILGAAGLLAPRWDIANQLRIGPLDRLTTGETTHLLVQYRYLKGFALATGVFGLLYRDQILQPGPANTAFLLLLGLAALGRVIGLAVDGRPHAMLTYVVIPFEIITPIVLYLATR